MAFQHWVAFVRNASPDVLAKEHLMCPLLWCRDDFKSLDSCLKHVSTCPWLPNAWYWCPLCHRPERFTAQQSRTEKNLKDCGQWKESKVKRAVSFFKHFGRRCASVRQPERRGAVRLSRPLEPTVKRISACGVDKKCEMDGNPSTPGLSSHAPDYGTKPPKLPSDDFLDHFPEDAQPSCKAVEMGRNSYVEHGGWEMDGYAPVELSSQGSSNGYPQHPELAGSSPAAMPTSPFSIEDRNDPSEPSSAMDLDQSDTSYVVSPCSTVGSPVQGSFLRCASEPSAPTSPISSSSIPRMLAKYHSIDVGSNSFDGYSAGWPIISNLFEYDHKDQSQHTLTDIVDTSMSDSSPLEGEAVSVGRHSQGSLMADDLRPLVHALSKDWVQSLALRPELSSVQERIASSSSYEKGLQTLRRCFCEAIPWKFEDVYSLMNLVVACAYSLYHDDASFSWECLFLDIVQWRHAIAEEEDRTLFVRIADLIWSPPGFSAAVRHAALIQPSSLGASPFSKENAVSASYSSAEGARTMTNRWPSLSLLVSNQETNPLQYLKHGDAIKTCLRYLDGKFPAPPVRTYPSFTRHRPKGRARLYRLSLSIEQKSS